LRTAGVELLRKEMELEIETIAKVREFKLQEFYSATPGGANFNKARLRRFG
jgi:hypothetical protein